MYQIKKKYITSNLSISKSIEIVNNKKIKTLKYKYKEYNKKKNLKNKINSSIKYIKIKQYSCKYFKQLYTNLNNTQNKLIKVYIKVTLNNIFVTYLFNNKIYTKSIASLGFKGKSKQTVYAYKTFAETVLKDLLNISANQPIVINLYIKSLSKKLKPLYHILKTNNIKINKIYDTTLLSFNGCRKRKIAIKKKRKSVIKFLSYL